MNATLDFESLALGTTLINLKCLKCDNLLSFFPIYISQDKRNICGRCYHTLETEKDKYIHNEAYETIAQFVHFPCRYKKEGCHEKLRPADIANHEELCSFRCIKCPTVEFTDCDWEGALPNTILHCNDKHHDIMLKNAEFDINLAEEHSCNNLFVCNSVLFIITRKFYAINKLLEISICNLGCEDGSKSIPCEIHFKSKSRRLVVSCSATPLTERQVTEIFLDCLKQGDHLPMVHCTISLDEVNKQNKVVITPEKTINFDLLSLLICSFCGNYALPPIYQDLSISSFGQNGIKCFKCVQKPGGAMQIGVDLSNNGIKNEVNNQVLDRIVSEQNYPCRFLRQGCSFIAKSAAMKIHQEFCSFRRIPCPLNKYVECKWLGFGSELTSHIENAHQNMFKTVSSEISERVYTNNVSVSYNNQVYTINPVSSHNNSANSNPSQVKCYVIKFSDTLFQVSFCEKQQHFYWTVHVIGQVNKQFGYELEIIDPSNRNKRLIIKNVCSSWKKKDQLFTHDKDICHLSRNQINSVFNNTLRFKITIFNFK